MHNKLIFILQLTVIVLISFSLNAQNYSKLMMLDSLNSQVLTTSVYINDSNVIVDAGMKFYNSGIGYSLGSALVNANTSTGGMQVKGSLYFDSLAILISKPNLIRTKSNVLYRGGCVKSYYSDYNELFICASDTSGANLSSHIFSLGNVQDSNEVVSNIELVNDSILMCSVVSYLKAPHQYDANIYSILFNVNSNQIEKQVLLYQVPNKFAESCGLIKNREGRYVLMGQTLKGVYIHIPDKYITNSTILFWELDSSLNIINFKEYNDDFRHRLEFGSTIEVPDGYIIAGSYDVTSTTIGTPDDLVQGNLWKVSKNFSTIWECRFDTNGYFNPPLMCVRHSPDSSIIVCGWDQDPQNMADGDSIWITKGMIAKVNYQGNVIWQRRWAGRYNKMTCRNFLTTCEVLSNGDIVAFGSAQTSQQNPNEAWILRLSKDGCINGSCENIYLKLIDYEFESTLFSLYPNPAKDKLYLYLDDYFNLHKNYHACITNTLGEKVYYVNSISESNFHTIDISNLQNGFYFFSLYQDDKIIQKQKFVKE